MARYQIEFDEEQRCRLKTPNYWADWGDAWLCAHDVFHHRPADVGTMAEEVMSFGAQLWLEKHTCAMRFGISSDSLCGVMVDAYAAHLQLDLFIVTEEPPAFTAVPREYVERFRHVVELGLFEASRGIDALRDAKAMPPISDEEMDTLMRDAHQHNYVQWMQYGYREAERRFNNAEEALVLCNQFALFVRACSRAGLDAINVELQEATLKLIPLEREAAVIWEDLSRCPA